MQIRNMMDTHVHFGPHVNHKANLNAFEIVERAQKNEMAAIVLKCNTFPSVGIAYLAGKKFQDISVYGGIVLNHTVGGLNYYAVESALRYGEGRIGQYCRFVCMPTFSAAADVAWHKRPFNPVRVVENGKVVDELKKILELVAEHNIILLTGHLGEDELIPLVQDAKARGIKKIVVPHPLNPVVKISLAAQKHLSGQGVYLQHCFVETTPYFQNKYGVNIEMADITGAIRQVGVDHAILASDLGADPGTNFPAVEGFSMFIDSMLEQGLTEKEIAVMTMDNPAKLLSL